MRLIRNRVMNKTASRAINTVNIAGGLRFISRRTLPLYSRIANDRLYATRLVNAVKAVNLNRVERIIRQEVEGAFVSVGAGFSAGLAFGSSQFEVGIFRPGQEIRTNDIRAVSRIMLPLLGKIAEDRVFAGRIARQFRLRRTAALLQLARTVVSPMRIRSANIDDFGFSFVVQLDNGSRYNFVFSILT
jgi:hypothetical protein